MRAIARAISFLETDPWSPDCLVLLKTLYLKSGKSRVIGVTGAPGVGKSTLVDALTRHYRTEDHRVAVLAIDPTSAFTGGAVLGDRIRMQDHAGDTGVFIRSMATRGHLGGLAPSVPEALIVLDAGGYETILIETVGVGQDEIEIAYTAETRIVVLSPDMGDDVQTMKAGIMEIADIFVLNKCDREGSNAAASSLQSLLQVSGQSKRWPRRLVQTVATQDQGTKELIDCIEEHQSWRKQSQHSREAQTQTLKYRLFELLQLRLRGLIDADLEEDYLVPLLKDLQSRQTDPYTVVDRIVSQFRRSRND
jgi:LAO/AO transport system kinase